MVRKLSNTAQKIATQVAEDWNNKDWNKGSTPFLPLLYLTISLVVDQMSGDWGGNSITSNHQYLYISPDRIVIESVSCGGERSKSAILMYFISMYVLADPCVNSPICPCSPRSRPTDPSHPYASP